MSLMSQLSLSQLSYLMSLPGSKKYIKHSCKAKYLKIFCVTFYIFIRRIKDIVNKLIIV